MAGWGEPDFSLLEWEVKDKQGEDQNDMCCNGLELEASVSAHVWPNIDTLYILSEFISLISKQLKKQSWLWN